MKSKKLAEKKMEIFLDHLEFLGFEICSSSLDDDNAYIISHPNRLDLLVQISNGAFVCHAMLPIKQEMRKDRKKLLSFVNELNEYSSFQIAGLTENNEVFFYSYYFGAYGKSEFGQFIDAINEDYSSTIRAVNGWEKYFEMENDE